MRPSSKMKARIHVARAAVRAPARKPGAGERAALVKRRAALDAGIGKARKLLSGKALEKCAATRIEALREQVTSIPDKAPGAVMVRAIARNEAGLPIPLVGARVRLGAGEQILAEAMVDPGGLALLPLADPTAEAIDEQIAEDMESDAKQIMKSSVRVGRREGRKPGAIDGRKKGKKPASSYEVAVLTPDGRAVARERGKWAEEGTAHVLEVASSKELEPYLRRGAGFARALAKAEDRAGEIVKTLRASVEAQIAHAERRITAIDRALAKHHPGSKEED